MYLLTCIYSHVFTDVYLLIFIYWHVFTDIYLLTCITNMHLLTCIHEHVFAHMYLLMCIYWHVFTDMRLLICSYWHVFIDMYLLTCLYWHVLNWHVFTDMYLLTCICWHVFTDMYLLTYIASMYIVSFYQLVMLYIIGSNIYRWDVSSRSIEDSCDISEIISSTSQHSTIAPSTQLVSISYHSSCILAATTSGYIVVIDALTFDPYLCLRPHKPAPHRTLFSLLPLINNKFLSMGLGYEDALTTKHSDNSKMSPIHVLNWIIAQKTVWVDILHNSSKRQLKQLIGGFFIY